MHVSEGTAHDPIYIILYVVIAAALVVAFSPQFRKANPGPLAASAIAGLAGLLLIMILNFVG